MNNDDTNPWRFIGMVVIGVFIGRALRRHWKLILAAFVIFLIYRHFVWHV